VPKEADIERKLDGIERWKAGGKRKKRKRKNLRRRRRCRGIRQDSMRTKSNRLDLPEFRPDIELLSVEKKVDAAGVSGLDDDFLPASGGALAAGGQQFG